VDILRGFRLTPSPNLPPEERQRREQILQQADPIVRQIVEGGGTAFPFATLSQMPQEVRDAVRGVLGALAGDPLIFDVIAGLHQALRQQAFGPSPMPIAGGH
jgi:hypothetical protein